MSDPEPEWGLALSDGNAIAVPFELFAVWKDKIWVSMPLSFEVLYDLDPEARCVLMEKVTEEMESLHQDERIRQGFK